MPRFTKAQKRHNHTPSFLNAARAFYGAAFSPTDRDDLAESMADWSELTDAEQSFAVAHLNYMNLVAQAGTQRLLRQCRSLLEEISDVLHDGLEAPPVHSEPQIEGGDPEVDEDDFPEMETADEPVIAEPGPDALPAEASSVPADGGEQ